MYKTEASLINLTFYSKFFQPSMKWVIQMGTVRYTGSRDGQGDSQSLSLKKYNRMGKLWRTTCKEALSSIPPKLWGEKEHIDLYTSVQLQSELPRSKVCFQCWVARTWIHFHNSWLLEDQEPPTGLRNLEALFV